MLSENDDAVTVGGDLPLRIGGRDSERLQCLLPEGHHVVELRGVLFVLRVIILSCFVEFEVTL